MNFNQQNVVSSDYNNQRNYNQYHNSQIFNSYNPGLFTNFNNAQPQSQAQNSKINQMWQDTPKNETPKIIQNPTLRQNSHPESEVKKQKAVIMEFDFNSDHLNTEAKKPKIESIDDKLVQPAGNNDYYNNRAAEEEDKQSFELKPLPKLQQKSKTNPHDERPIGGGRIKSGVDDLPINSKVSNFEELLEKELRNNPDASPVNVNSSKSVQPKKNNFLKRKQPVTAPPKSSKVNKYKYYAENFDDDPFNDNDKHESSKPVPKTKDKTPFANVAQRLTSSETDNKEEKVKENRTKKKKTFLVRGGGTGGGIGSKEHPKEDNKDDSKLKANKQAIERKQRSNRSHCSSKSKTKAPSKNRQIKATKKKIFDSESEDNSSQHEDQENFDDEEDRVQRSIVTKSPKPKINQYKDNEEDEEAAQPPILNIESNEDDSDLIIKRTVIPEHLLADLPQNILNVINEKMYLLDTEIAKHEKQQQVDKRNKRALQDKLEQLKSEKEEIDDTQCLEIKRLNDYKDQELKKIKEERKEFRKQQKEKQGDDLNSKGKQEIEDLNIKIENLKTESKNKDKKSNAIIDELKAELEYFNTQNNEVKSEIKQLERQRVKMMQDKDNKIKVAPKQHDSFRRQVNKENLIERSKPKAIITRFENLDDNKSEENHNEDEVQEEQNEEELDSDEDTYQMIFHSKYHNNQADNIEPVQESLSNNNKIQRMFRNGKKELIFNNGVRKQIFPDGYSIVYFANDDIKQTYPDGK